MRLCASVRTFILERLKFRSKIIVMPALALIKRHKKLILTHGNCPHISMCILLNFLLDPS